MFQISQFASGFDLELVYLRLIGPLLAEMASLKPNILTTLLEDMKLDEKGSEDVRKPVLLQIRSIIPALEEGDLWPNRGFYLKVSDLTHAMYASLPHEQDDMILSNKLQLGQFIYVQKLDAAYPVPVLRGVMPVPGRRTCDGTPEDIVPLTNLVKFLENSDIESVKDKGVILENKGLNRWASDSESLMERNIISTDVDNRPTRSVSVCDEIRGIKPEACSTEHETDSDSPTSSSLSSSANLSKRRSWNETELLDVKKMFDSSVAKIATKPKPKPRSRSAGVSPIRNVKNDSSDDNSTSTPRRRNCLVSSVTNTAKAPNRSKAMSPKVKRHETPRSEAVHRIISDRKASDSRISWDSLPSNLANCGKEMIRDRDMAIHAAVEAMQEACAADKLVKCISTYSEFQSLKGDDPQPFVDKFFDLQDDLSQARLVVQSLTNISPLRSSDTDINNTGSVKEVLNLAVERKKNATSWVKSAIACDLSPFPSSLRPPPGSPEASRTPKKANSNSSRANKPTKLTCVSSKQRKNTGDIAVGVTSEKDWVKGSALSGAGDLANILQEESRRSFLVHVEKFLDEAEDKTSGINSDSQIAGMMYQIKRVHDWIDFVNKDAGGGKEGSGAAGLGEAEIETCGRLKSKIYDVLLKHVERTAMALENMNAGGLH